MVGTGGKVMNIRKWLPKDGDDWFFTILFGIVVIFAIAIILIRIFDPTSLNSKIPCHDTLFSHDQSFACLDYRVQQCAASERYTREECIVLVGGEAK
jgi:hypothetical protein